MAKSSTRERAAWLSILILALSFQRLQGFHAQEHSNEDTTQLYTALLEEAMQEIRQTYIDSSKTGYKNLIYGAIEGMLNALQDPHTMFLDEEEYRALQVAMTQEFAGIGLHLDFSESFPRVISPIDNTSAFHAGIQAGDRIVQIEGESTQNMTYNQILNALNGELGSSIHITIARDDETLSSFTLQHRRITLHSVHSLRLHNSIAYLRITFFGKSTADEVREHIEGKLAGAPTLILDIRNNPGGLVHSAIDIANMFLSSGNILSTRGSEHNTHIIHADPQSIFPTERPLIVLVNPGTASAAEILAGALQDNHRGILLGEKTYGKGSAQSIIELHSSQESIAVQITTQEYLTPQNKSIHTQGITPNIPFSPSSIRPQTHPLRSEELLQDPQIKHAYSLLWQRLHHSHKKA